MTTMPMEKPKPRARRRRLILNMPWGYDRPIHLCIFFLAVFGLFMIASASMGLAVGRTWYIAFVVVKQLVFLFAGYFMMTFLATYFSIKYLKSSSFPALAVITFFALLICLAFPATNGARAWIRVPVSTVDISIQPSEFTKIMVMLVIAAYCGDVKKKFKSSWDMVKRPLFFVIGYIFIIMVLQSDTGSAVVIALIAAFCFLIPRHPQMRHLQRWIRALLILGLAGALFLLSPAGEQVVQHLPLEKYQINRFLSAINPFTDLYGAGYQLVNGLVSFATGGWTGLGFGNSVRKYTNFPAANTDFILAIVVEELGIVGFLLIFIPYIIIIVRLFVYALKMESECGRIILTGTALYLVIHCLFNIGGVTGLIPLTGVPLLMISSGGSSTMSFMMAIGVAQAVIAQYKRGEIK